MVKKIRVACVGDSITEGFGGIPYPEQLQALLGEGYDVKNFGKFGTHLRVHDCDWSYSLTSEYKAALSFLPDVVLFMLGTNDRLDEDYPYLNSYFAEDFVFLTSSFLKLPSRPKLFVATSPCCYTADGTAERVNKDIRARQIFCAGEAELSIIDINTCTSNRSDLFPDLLHPDTAGYALIADSFYRYAFGGKMHSVKVNCYPGEEVYVGNRRTTANGNGVAVFKAAEGDNITVKAGDRSKTVNLHGDIEIDMK